MVPQSDAASATDMGPTGAAGCSGRESRGEKLAAGLRVPGSERLGMGNGLRGAGAGVNGLDVGVTGAGAGADGAGAC